MNVDLIELYGHMGWFAKGIVFVMLGMSIWSLTVMIQKWWALRKAQAETRKFAPEFSQFLEEDNLTEAIKLAESYKKSHVARVLGGALRRGSPAHPGRLRHRRRHQLGGARGRAQHADRCSPS